MRRGMLIPLLAMLPLMVWGKPARPVPTRYVQPDGSTISIVLRGNGSRHVAEDVDGRPLSLDAGGFYRLSPGGRASLRAVSSGGRDAAVRSIVPSGEVHIPVIPIAFSDVGFSFDDIREMLNALLNEEGYSYSGACGSVRDYYVENSHGAFMPCFDVMDPVTLDSPMAVYGANSYDDNDRAPELALYEACVKLDPSVDFSVYDNDGDGLMDLIIYYYAGYDEAEYGSADAIWSHRWDARESLNRLVNSAVFDGVRLGPYFCTSELSGNSGDGLTAIGSTCHEFGHALGLPDFYDSNSAEDGYAGGMYAFSVMDMGCYNNESRTPPYMNALERQMLGWIGEIPGLDGGPALIRPVQEGAAFMAGTSTEGEYFLFEARSGSAWDAPLPAGLLVYHVDSSERPVGTYTAAELPGLNLVNAYGAHPCAYIVPSSDRNSLYFRGVSAGIPFPGVSGNVFLDVNDWNGEGLDTRLSDISLMEDGAVSVFVIKGLSAIVTGVVSDTEGETVQGALVSVDIAEPRVVTDRDGRFILELPEGSEDLPFRLTASHEGYRRTLVDACMEGRSAYLPVVLRRSGESALVSLSRYDPSETRIFYPFPSRDFGDCMGAVRWTAGELFPYVGRRIEIVDFFNYVQGGEAEAAYVIVDFGDERVLTHRLEDPSFGLLEENVADISAYDIRIPEGLDIYVGYGIKGSGYVYPLAATLTGEEGNSFYARLDPEHSDWTDMYSERSSTGFMNLLLSAGIREVTDPMDMSRMGYATIDVGNGTWKEKDMLPLRLKDGREKPVSVTWLFDGEEVREDEVRLAKGSHTVEARLEYTQGRRENLKVRISCE